MTKINPVILRNTYKYLLNEIFYFKSNYVVRQAQIL